MRLPTAWDDDSLLEDEPLGPLFWQYGDSRAARKSVLSVIQSQPEYLNQIEAPLTAWLQLAFTASREERDTVKSLAVPTGEKGLKIFIEFYWHLFRQQKGDAIRSLQKERKARGFWYPVPKEHGEHEEDESVRPRVEGRAHSSKPKHASQLATRGKRKSKRTRAQRTEEQYDAEASDGGGQDALDSRASRASASLSAIHTRNGQAVSSYTGRKVISPDLSESGQAQGQKMTGMALHTGAPTFKEAAQPSDRKRKAVNEQPSSTSQSSSDGDVSLPQPDSLQDTLPAVQDSRCSSPLTVFTSDGDEAEAPHTTLNASDAGPIAPVSVFRRNPSRVAAKPQILTEMMHAETQHQKRRARGVLDMPEYSSSDDLPARSRLPLATRGRSRRGRGGKAKKQETPNLAGSLSSIMMPPTRATRLASAKAPLDKLQSRVGASGTALRSDTVTTTARGNSVTRRKTAKKPTKHFARSSTAVKKPGRFAASISDSHSTRKRRRVGEDGNYNVVDDDTAATSVPRKGRKNAAGFAKQPKATAEAQTLQDRTELIMDASAVSRGRRTHKSPFTMEPPIEQPQAGPRAVSPRQSGENVCQSSPRYCSAEQQQPALHFAPSRADASVSNDSELLDVVDGSQKPAVQAKPTGTLPPPGRGQGKRKRSSDLLAATVPVHVRSRSDRPPRTTKRLPRKLRTKTVTASLTIVIPPRSADRNEIDTTIRNAAAEALRYHTETQRGLDPTSDWEGQASQPEDAMSSNEDEDHEPDRPAPAEVALSELMIPSASAFLAGSTPLQLPRPPLRGYPPIWAESRQEVCESFDWFRSYQGGVYFMNDLVKGYLLGGFSSSRDVFEHSGRLIISHGGGKAESLHTKAGQSHREQADDQLAEDKSVRALLKTYKSQKPLVLLADDRYVLFPFDLASRGCSYVVLGYYRIAHAWAEPQPAANSRGYVVRYKFAFQWCSEQGDPWWTSPPHVPQEEPAYAEHDDLMNAIDMAFGRSTIRLDPVDVAPSSVIGGTLSMNPSDVALSKDMSGPVVQHCTSCHANSPLVYVQGWMCLKPTCPSFWKLSSGAVPSVLAYAEKFLELLPFHCDMLPELTPRVPVLRRMNGIATTRLFCKGWHCTRCGRLSSRYKWEHWECANCHATYSVAGRLRNPKEFWFQARPETYMNHHVAPDSGIIVPLTESYACAGGRGFYHQYILPHGRGRIFLIVANSLVNHEADTIFKEYQEQAQASQLLFRRWPMRAHKCRGNLLTNYFSQNSGEPYQYVGGAANTVSWAEAPSAVRKALALIKLRMENALGMPADDFNEVLSAGYMEKQKMAFHSDAERGLGPTVASLSLGSAAHMYFRLHAQYDDKVGKGANRNALSLFLRHGDVLVMEGEGVQKYYEHTVVPLNFRIAATARCIGQDNALIKI